MEKVGVSDSHWHGDEDPSQLIGTNQENQDASISEAKR